MKLIRLVATFVGINCVLAASVHAAPSVAPTISGTPVASIKTKGWYVFQPTARDANFDKLGFTIVNKPSWATFSTVSGNLWGTAPAAGGTYNNIVISVSDGRLTTSLPAFSINVVAANSSSSSSSSSRSSSSSSSVSSSTSSVPSSPSRPGPTADNCQLSLANTQAGTAAALGAPTTTLFNGVQIVQDKLHRCAKHAVDAAAAVMPAPLVNSAMPYMPKVKVLSRRDAVMLYLPNIAGAADYRAYVVGSGVTFAGSQPRNAVIACAGFRQRHYDLELGGATPWHELLQTLELPGLNMTGNYTIIVEAIKSPCPFTGMPAATDADITISERTNRYAGNSKASFRSFNTVRARYGNEIINGQGSATSWNDRMNMNIWRGVPVDPASTTIPKDPVVIARSAIKLSLPATDETISAPIIDVGANATHDDFSENLVVAPSSITNNNELAGPGNQWFAPLATIPGSWTFWGHNIQHADGDVGKTTGMRGAQIFQRYGRLYQTSGDAVQCCMSSIMFSSLKTLPQQLDSTKYVHSFFRVNSDATSRRYWVWLMCGGATREELVNTSTRMPLFRPAMDPGDFDAMGTTPNSFTGKNPSMRHGNEPASTTRYNKECLQFIQHGVAEPHWPSTASRERSASRLMLVLHPKDVPQGTISYAPSASDWYQPGFPGWTHRVDPNNNYVGPMMEPFDQHAPLTHFDLFVRPDRVVVFINGRQALCANMATRPLTMKYGLIMYGNALYHTSAETEEAEVTKSADYHYRLNEPIADTRAWDAVGHSEKIDIPTNIFTTFDASQCTTPASTKVM